ncbi:hypothetical protein Cob_v003044 [Colletotrichum orbiculare MAFF 240422]|uniref:Uncharacterized protein n=1 Tax=Colletotrichum orbiculare (strain 104-T / ATCC 96160 / CBS 514.97 / LARS 414 / MAFF 240422) TaxID=1213857 RepID=A0A484G2U5_COLOR|nr:hypothetical protein Cob_v003044 [Colletotrichum orbiculare MAFF 240422]
MLNEQSKAMQCTDCTARPLHSRPQLEGVERDAHRDQLRQPRKKPFASHHFEQPDFVNALPIVFQVLIDLRTTSLYRLAFAID